MCWELSVVYPQSDNLHGAEISFYSDDGVSVEISFINLLQQDASVQALI
jgi:hypothetical protein